MNNYNSESYSDGDYEDKEDLVWNEFAWQEYLSKNKKDVAKFTELFKKSRYDYPTFLEELAKFMGWSKIESIASDSYSTLEIEFEEIEDNEEDWFGYEPYTVHRHPLYFLTTSLYQYTKNNWEEFLGKNSLSISPIESWRFAMSLNEGQTNSMMAVYAIDTGDYALAICHLKHALSAINESFRVLQGNEMKAFKEIQAGLFNLREVFLKAIYDCREYDMPDLSDFE